MLTLTPTSAVPFRILDVPALPPDAPLNPLRVAQLAHEAARLHYSFIKLPVDGCMVYIAARFPQPSTAPGSAFPPRPPRSARSSAIPPVPTPPPHEAIPFPA